MHLLPLPVFFHLVLSGVAGPGCEEVEKRVAEADQNTLILYPPDLHGVWLSDRCEGRGGPEYVLRWHTYGGNGSYTEVLHRYGDPSCSEPSFSTECHGSFRLKSWMAPVGAEAEFVPEAVFLVPHSQQVAEELGSLLKESCPGLPRLRAKTVLAVFTSSEAETVLPSPTEWWMGDLECLRPLRLSHNGVSFLRTQVRPPSPPDLVARTELLLGESSEQGTKLRPPLLYLSQAGGRCTVCLAVDRASLTSPPLLPASGPLRLAGEWVSLRCEPKQRGLFLKRRLRISGVRWAADFKVYSDPSCAVPALTASGEGRISEPAESRGLPGVADLDFSRQRASITLHDPALVPGLSCGPPGPWQVGVKRDLTPTSGCPGLGISVPSTEYELVRLELDPSGQVLLYLGRSGERKVRPTDFQPPLLQCDAPELPPLTHFLNSMNRASSAIRQEQFVLAAVFIINHRNIF